MTITASSAGVCESGAVCVESLNGLPDANTVDLCPSLEEITDRCVPSSRPSTSPSEGPSNVPSGMPSKEVSTLSHEDIQLYLFYGFTFTDHSLHVMNI